MKYAYVYTLFLMLVFHTACGQKQTNAPQDNFSKEHNGLSESQFKEADTSKVPISQVRNVKQDRNGNILIAARWDGVFRYDGKSFTNLTSKLGSQILGCPGRSKRKYLVRFSLIQVFIITMGNPFNILQPGRDLLIMRLCVFTKIKPALFGSALEEVE